MFVRMRACHQDIQISGSWFIRNFFLSIHACQQLQALLVCCLESSQLVPRLQETRCVLFSNPHFSTILSLSRCYGPTLEAATWQSDLSTSFSLSQSFGSSNPILRGDTDSSCAVGYGSLTVEWRVCAEENLDAVQWGHLPGRQHLPDQRKGRHLQEQAVRPEWLIMVEAMTPTTRVHDT